MCTIYLQMTQENKKCTVMQISDKANILKQLKLGDLDKWHVGII